MKKSLSFALAMVLAFVLAACGGGGSGSSGGGSQGGQSGTGGAAAPDGPFGRYDPPISLTSVLDIPADFTYPEGATAEDNLYTQAFLDELGIDISYDWVTYSGNYSDRMKMMISSNELPDFFKIETADRQTFNMLVEAGMLADLTDVFEEYASDRIKSYLPEGSPAREAVTKDGRMYGIPNYSDPREATTMLWVRSDWLKNLNLEVPKTGEDLLAVAEAFTFDDPDGNGSDDTYGFSMDGSLGIGDIYWNMYQSYPDIWIDNGDGTLVNGMFGNDAQIAATRDGLLTLRDLYAKGVVDPEFTTKEVASLGEAATNNKFGIFFDSLWAGYGILQQNVSANPGAEWIPIALPSMTDEPAMISGESVMLYEIHVVRKDFENPEAMIQIINLFDKYNSDPEYADMAVWNTDPVSNSFIAKLAPVMLFDPLFNLNSSTRLAQAINSGDESKVSKVDELFYSQIMDYRDNGNRDLWCVDASYGPEGALSVCKYYADNNLNLANLFSGIPTQAMLEKQPVIEKQWLEVFTRVVMGADISEYDTFVQNYGASGGDVLYEEVNAWYKAQ